MKFIETNAIGIVEEIKRNKATVLFGNIRSVIPMEDLILDISKDNQVGMNKRKMDLKDREQISNELDLRGMFQQEAMQELEQFIDRALLNNVWQFKIIHGTGVLKKAVWNALRNFKQLDKYYHPSKESGGEGATVVQV
ncbi:MAG: Smr/MutS family protein [Bacteroidetes bacterium]|nr:Smr/MutS family protein [Bacteroidota bacterium]